jgi:hypothetical protein
MRLPSSARAASVSWTARLALALVAATSLAPLAAPAPAAAQASAVKPRILIAFDTSGSMAQDFDGRPTFGDGTTSPNPRLAGVDTNCDGQPNDSRMFIAKAALRDMLAAFGDIDFALARFPQIQAVDRFCAPVQNYECNTAGPYVTSYGNPNNNTGATCAVTGWGSIYPSGPGCFTPAFRHRRAGDPIVCINYEGQCSATDGNVLVGWNDTGAFTAQDNTNALYKWLDGIETANATDLATTTTGDFCRHSTTGNCELRAEGATPLGGLLTAARNYITPIRMADTIAACRPYSVILITDGLETCGGDPVAAATQLRMAGIPVYVIGLAIAPASRTTLNNIATAGGTDAGPPGGDTAYFANDRVTLAAGLSEVVRRSLLVESCNNLDDNCNALIDEGLPKFCNTGFGVAAPDCSNTAVNRPACTLCAPPAETHCDGIDNNCNGQIDEGLRNACGNCGPTPAEVCDGIDNDCDGLIDEGGVCGSCTPSAEICDGIDNDCDGLIDEGLTRSCGTSVGECTVGTQTCTAGAWGACSGRGPTPETCDNRDNDCDGVVDGLVESCGSSVGACRPGTRVCTAGSFGACVGAVGPSPEICDGVDNNCNGTTDEGNPGGGGACGSSIGECRPGTLACTGGRLVCTGGVSPAPETCDNRDNDCNGAVDDGVPTMGPCGSTTGECRAGVRTCVAGSFTCVGARGPTTELCNGLDDNCDGRVDEGNPGGGVSCGSDVGICTRGMTMCTGGMLVCTGGTGPRAEVCNGLDDNCDGRVDEGNPGGGASCGSSVGVCTPGTEACVAGRIDCVGGTRPGAELCNGLDDDCDGEVDEGNPEAGRPCGDDTGECTAGVTECTAGRLVCRGGTGPTEEVCNGLDDDCDGAVDEGLGVGAPCGSDEGECSPGVQICRGGMVVCEGQILPAPEVCNALDDDCDGEVDEGLGLGGPCGSSVGACMPGREQCIGGRLLCVGEVPPTPEGCDCEDNDCDGEVDEPPPGGSLCPPGSACVECSCSRPCERIGDVGVSCPTGRIPFERPDGTCFCVEPRCEATTCQGQTVEVGGAVRCAPGVDGVPTCVCKNNQCTFPCDGVVCGGGTVCNPRTGFCVEDSCRGLGCPRGQLCDVRTGACTADACEGVTCGAAEACRAGVCEPSCADVRCAAGQRCVRGVCEADPCSGVSCPTGRVCDRATGMCVADPCEGRACPIGQVCSPSGECVADPCDTLRCPARQVCREGECVREGERPDGGVDMGDGRVDLGREEERVLASGGGGCICSAPGTSAGRPAGTGGGAPGGAALLALAGLALLGARRVRRAGRVAAAVTVVGGGVTALALGAGCDVDPYCITCGDTPRDAGVDLGEVDLGVDLGRDLGVDLGEEDAGRDGCVPGAPELCNGVDDNCDGNVDEGYDLMTDALHCGRCGNRCEYARAFGVCTAGACSMGECDVGFYDRNGRDSDGCEYRCIPTEVDDRVCDLRDNDCDGEVDEDVDFQNDPVNCGACARTCVFARAVAGCSMGACTIASCMPGYYDRDGDVRNGCEYACTPADPPVEVCNGRDDDCNGMIDEGNPGAGAPCGSAVGACRPGTLSCMGGALVCMGEVAPTTEVCNGVDDDCDGEVDEGNPEGGALCGSGVGACTRGREECRGGRLQCIGAVEPTAEVCNGIDDNCDGMIDEGDPGGGMPCGSGVGACRPGTTRCTGGVVVCQGGTGPSTEVCNGIDDNCDGMIDEGNPGGGTPCGTDVGQCRPGTRTCMGGTLQCVGAVGPTAELCNGLDDNCDGRIDEDVPPMGSCGSSVGECRAGTLRCAGGSFQCQGAIGPALETCNGRDDDCDGMVDEDFDLLRDPRNCGMCGRVCSFANGVAGCSMGACQLLACNPGFVNRDGVASNGCEYACDFAGAEVCNGRDDDCNGMIDEGLTPPPGVCNPNGVCAMGTVSCAGASGWRCTLPATYQEVETRCDNLDNDCDGMIDEPFPLRGTPCANGIGACRRTGTFVCNVGGTATVCNAPPAGAATPETCNNVDDDCNGTVDDGIAPAAYNAVRMTTGTSTGRPVWVAQYEASRADATDSRIGSASRVACSNPNVLPWTDVTWTAARNACCALNAGGTCGATGWNLCAAADWQRGCQGDGGTACTWSYASMCTVSQPLVCNGDEFDANPSLPGDQDEVRPTGSFPMCYTSWSSSRRVYDMSGNVKEWTSTSPSSGTRFIRGGSYNNLEVGRTCTFDFTIAAENFSFPNTGFRCCFYE